MKRKCSGITIRPVDQKLFAYLYAYKSATSEQIGRDIFPTASRKTVVKRLRKLRRLGYIAASAPPETSPWLVYSVTPTTFREYISADGELRRELKSDSVRHDLDLVDVAHHLKRSGKVRAYYPENLIASGLFAGSGHGVSGLNLRPFAELNSDAAVDMSFNAGNYVFAVEYESSLKAKLRYKVLFDSYLAAAGIPIVLYVCRDAEIESRLEAYETEFVPDSVAKFFYTTLRDLKEKIAPIFTNRRSEVLRIGSALGA